jgi:hypothetical protein
MELATIDDIKKEPIAIPNQDYQRAIEQAYAAIRSSDGCVPGSFFPLTHQFANGMYIRTIFVPKGYMVLTYVHKQSHPAFQLKGDTTVIEPTGNKRIKGQHQFITAAGTQRLCYCHEDTVWTTVHLNLKNETDIDKIEKEIYASHYSELFIEVKKGELSFMENEGAKNEIAL